MYEILVMTGPNAKTGKAVLATDFIVDLSDQDQDRLRVIRASINEWHGPRIGHPSSGESAQRFFSRLAIALIEMGPSTLSPITPSSPEQSFVDELAAKIPMVKVRNPNVLIDKATAKTHPEARDELLRLFARHGLGHKYVWRIATSMTFNPSSSEVTSPTGKTRNYATKLRDTSFASLEAAFRKFVWIGFADLNEDDARDIASRFHPPAEPPPREDSTGHPDDPLMGPRDAHED